VRDIGLPTPPFVEVQSPADVDRVSLKFPLFAKPVAEGTSKGITAASKITSATELRAVSGFPISGIAANQALMSKWQTGTHGGTYGGNVMGCAAAEATIDVIRTERLVENAAERGRQLLDGLQEIQARFPALGDVRGLGLMVGCEFIQPDSGEPDPGLTQSIVRRLREAGQLLVLSCGMYANVIRWIPPLVVSEAQINEGLTRFEQALTTSA
jgi:4-aminobutyrate aminotransferase-like enzyme